MEKFCSLAVSVWTESEGAVSMANVFESVCDVMMCAYIVRVPRSALLYCIYLPVFCASVDFHINLGKKQAALGSTWQQYAIRCTCI